MRSHGLIAFGGRLAALVTLGACRFGGGGNCRDDDQGRHATCVPVLAAGLGTGASNARLRMFEAVAFNEAHAPGRLLRRSAPLLLCP